MSFHAYSKLITGANLILWLLVGVQPSQAIMVLGGADPTENKVAPTGEYAGAGWQFQGMFGAYLGTMISPTQFITAKHINIASSTFVYHSTFSGGTNVTYTVDTVNFHDIPGSDLRVFNIVGDVFPTYAEIYTKPLDVELEFVTFGRGAIRGEEVYGEARNELGIVIGTELKGWKVGNTGTVPRWGTNEIALTTTVAGLGEVFLSTFDDNGNANEAYLSVGDSGGGVFILDTDDNTWKLAGINYGDGGFFNTSPTSTGSFRGAIFDRGGLYYPNSWVMLPDQSYDMPATNVFSDVTARYDYLMENVLVMPVPEPSTAGLVAVSGLLWGFSRNRKRVRVSSDK